MRIALICPSKGRPDKMQRMWRSAIQTANDSDLLSLRLGVNEEEISLYAPHICGNVSLVAVKDWSTVFSLNVLAVGAIQEKADILIIVGDDAVFSTPGWDEALLNHYDALENKVHVYSLLDSRSENGTPHPIATRQYVEAMGYLATPIFMHWFVDTWMVAIAKHNGCFTHMKDFMLEHDKPSDRGEYDETHTSIRARGWFDRDKYVDATCQHMLGLEKERLGLVMQHIAGTKEHMD